MSLHFLNGFGTMSVQVTPVDPSAAGRHHGGQRHAKLGLGNHQLCAILGVGNDNTVIADLDLGQINTIAIAIFQLAGLHPRGRVADVDEFGANAVADALCQQTNHRIRQPVS